MASSSDSAGRPLVLLTGATGYIGGRLLKGLEKTGWPVRCLARHPEFLQQRVAPSAQVVKGDCLDLASLPPVMAGVHTAYYLVHSMGSSGKFKRTLSEATWLVSLKRGPGQKVYLVRHHLRSNSATKWKFRYLISLFG